ncbi:hypothetical protein ABIE44_000202 [Marmoricola sp. OAE513]|uniref:nuclear transport factor 2 family protein n=1 Tax=Marmoricola sp. OAE513 TaxID=2817894 RepID=UPI001AE477AD
MSALTPADRLDLVELTARYAAAADSRDWDGVAEQFTLGGVLVTPDPPHSMEPVVDRAGRDAIRETVSRIGRFARTVHHLTGSVWQADGDGASGRTTAIAHHVEAGPEPLTWVWHLVYDDRCARTDDGWRFTRRSLTLVLVESRPVFKVLPFDPTNAR